MKKFNILNGIGAPLPMVNVDTDMIIPKQYLKTIYRSGLGKFLFDELRYNHDGEPISDFVLNKEPFQNTKILITGKNFGCGSSREHAPWALLDFGISCIIAPSFADIFYNNCFQNGMLPIILSGNELEYLMNSAQNNSEKNIKIDLESQTISHLSKQIKFKIDSDRKYKLLNGLDNISLTEKNLEAIKQFENKQKITLPWLYA